MADFRINVIVDPSRAKRGTDAVNRQLDRTATKANNLGAALRRALGFLGAGLIARQAIGTLASFSQEMSTVASVTNATAAEFAALEERAISLGTNTRFTATQAAEGLTELGRAGLSTSESLEAIGDALLLAQAGNLSIADSAAIATTAVKVFNLEAADTATVADTLVLAANNTKTNVSEMGQAFTFAAANAKDLEVDVNDTAAALGVLAEGGLTATRGGTALRAVLVKLSAPTREAEVALRNAGLSLSDIDIKARGLRPVLETLAAAQLDTADKAAIFGGRFAAASSILFNNLDKFDELNVKFDTLGGEAQRVADVMDDNLNGSLLALRSAFEGLIIRVGQNGAGGALRSFVDTVASGLRAAADNVERFIRSVQGLAFVMSVTLARKAIPAVIVQLRALGIAIATNPLGALATALTLVVGSLIAVRDELTLTADSFTTVSDVATAAFAEIKSLVDSFVPLFESFGESIANALGTSFDGFELNLQNALLATATFADTALGIFLALGNSLTALFNGIGPSIGSAFFVILNGINDLVEGAIDLTRAGFETIADVAGTIGFRIIQFFRELDLAATQLAQGQAGAAAETAKQAADQLSQGLAAIPKQFVRDFKRNLTELEGEDLLGDIANPFEGAGADMAANMTKGFEDGLSFSGLTDFTLRTFQAADAMAVARIAAEEQAAAQENLNEKIAEGNVTLAQVPEKIEPATQAVASFGEQLNGGFAAGLEAGIAGITDVSGAAESLMVNAFGAAEDALVSFITTGEADFEAFVDGFLEDLARLLARQALFGLISSFGGGSLVGAAGASGGGGGLFGGARAEGGPVNPNQAFLVGEEGPEMFVPPGAGNIMTASQTAAAGGDTVVQAPPVNVSVVNTSNPEDTIAAMTSAQGMQTILNAIEQNPTAVRNALQ